MLTNFQFVQKIANQLIHPRPCNYVPSDIWKHISNKDLYKYQSYHCNILPQRSITLHMIQKRNQQNITRHSSSTCILYLHGFSSFCGEGSFLTQNLEKQLKDINISLCLYDLRGHGKDIAKNVTFGLQQSKQLCNSYHYLVEILLYLKKQKHFENFILWGRSMGATTILKMLSDHKMKINSQNIHIKLLVLDSGFSSFEKIAREIISKKSGIPTIFSKPIFQYLISAIEKQHKFKLVVDLDKLNQITTSAVLLYSEKDDLISSQHSKYIYQQIRGQKHKIQTGVGHNEERSPQILKEVFQMVRNSLKDAQNNLMKRRSMSCKKVGLSVTKSNKRLRTIQATMDDQEQIPLSLRNKFKLLVKSPKNKDQLIKKTQQKLYHVNQNPKIQMNQNSIKSSSKPINILKPDCQYLQTKIKNITLIEESPKTQGYSEKENIYTHTQNIQEKDHHKKDQKIKLSSKNLDRVKSTGKLNSYKSVNHFHQNPSFIHSQNNQQRKKQITLEVQKRTDQELLNKKLQIQKNLNQQKCKLNGLKKPQNSIQKPQSENIHRLKSKIHSLLPQNNFTSNREKPNSPYLEQGYGQNHLRSSIDEELSKQNQRSRNNPMFFNHHFTPKIKNQQISNTFQSNRRLFSSNAQSIRRLTNLNYF